MWFWFPPSASTRFGNAWSAATHSASSVLGLIIWALPRDQRQLDHAVRIRLAHGTHYELRSPGCDPIAWLGVGGQVGGVNGDLFRARGRPPARRLGHSLGNAVRSGSRAPAGS